MGSNDDPRRPDKPGLVIDPMVQIILGVFLIAGFCALVWLKIGVR